MGRLLHILKQKRQLAQMVGEPNHFLQYCMATNFSLHSDSSMIWSWYVKSLGQAIPWRNNLICSESAVESWLGLYSRYLSLLYCFSTYSPESVSTFHFKLSQPHLIGVAILQKNGLHVQVAEHRNRMLQISYSVHFMADQRFGSVNTSFNASPVPKS